MAGTVRRWLSVAVGHSFAKFAVVGVIGFGTDVGLLWLLYGVLHLWLPVATGLAYLVAFAISFVLSREWVFPDTGNMRRQVYRYCWLVAGVLLLTVLGVKAVVSLGVQYLVAKVLISGVVAVVNYVVSRWWVFRATPVPALAEPEPEQAAVAP